MWRWELNAPPNRHQAPLDGVPTRNTQITRLAYVLRNVGLGVKERVYSKLARFTRRNDGNSYVSKDALWTNDP